MNNQCKNKNKNQEKYIIEKLFNNDLTDIDDLEIELEGEEYVISYKLLDADGWLSHLVIFDPTINRFEYID